MMVHDSGFVNRDYPYRLAIYLTDEMAAFLLKESSKAEVSQTEFVRRLLKEKMEASR